MSDAPQLNPKRKQLELSKQVIEMAHELIYDNKEMNFVDALTIALQVERNFFLSEINKSVQGVSYQLFTKH